VREVRQPVLQRDRTRRLESRQADERCGVVSRSEGKVDQQLLVLARLGPLDGEAAAAE
jgi:hypothetical protein